MRFSHELFRALLLVSNDPIGVTVTLARSKRSKISVAALNFGALSSLRTRLRTVLGGLN
jgi:hypothetical protein